MKTHFKSTVNFFIFASVAMMSWMSINPISGQTQNLQLQEIKQNRERDTITITARLLGDFKFDTDGSSSNVFFTLLNGRVIPLGIQSGEFLAEEIASVYIYRPNRKKDPVIEVIISDEDDDNDTSDISYNIHTQPAKRIIYIVDGMELMEKHVHNIPPTDILNITVLKDESAAEKYGKNPEEIDGIIVIETRRANFNE